jgi:sterol desaturase/sphingolipid hydroxylase (fatty acid hydroxylase superfamily)
MDTGWLHDALVAAWKVVGFPFDADGPFYWPFLLSAVAIGLFMYGLQAGPKPSLKKFFFPREVWAHPSARVGYVFVPLSLLVAAVLIKPLAAAIEHNSAWVADGLIGLFGPPASPWPAPIAMTVLTVAGLIVSDALLYGLHWLGHFTRWGWAIHRVHHSPEVLTFAEAQRFHPIEFAAMWLVTAGAGALLGGATAYLAGAAVPPWQLMGVHVGVFVFFFAGGVLRHSHLWLEYPTWLSRYLVSPAMHQIHHSRETRHLDKNLGVIFSWWDRLFGTLYLPAGRETFRMGVTERADELRTVGELFLAPFRRRSVADTRKND